MIKKTVLIVFSALLLTACGGSPGDLSTIKPGSKDAFILIKAEITGRQCNKKSLEIGRRTKDGTYKKVAKVPIGTRWSQTGVQASLAPGEYHIVGLVCFTSFNAAFIPGRREPSVIPFNPTYYDSLGHFTVVAGEVVALGNMRLAMQEDGRFGVAVTPFSDGELQNITKSSPAVKAGLTSRPLISAAEPVEGRCVLGTVKVGCSKLKILHAKLMGGAAGR